ncbi:MAG: hypothetical protein IJW32_03620 [Clostridia bacterium]|nr:hypothetical protein [Clostridia bacterium]
MFFKSKTYNKFKLRKWKKLSNEEKLVAYQELENIQAKKQKRPVYDIVVEDLEKNVMGRCSSSKKVIKLDIDLITKNEKRFYGMSVLFHEGRHAYQYDEITETDKPPIFSKKRKWKKNWEGYVSTAESDGVYSFYSMQPIERDAEKYALKRLKQFKLRYLFEKDFKETLKAEKNSFVKAKEKAIKELGFFYKIRVTFRSWQERRKNKKENKKNRK